MMALFEPRHPITIDSMVAEAAQMACLNGFRHIHS